MDRYKDEYVLGEGYVGEVLEVGDGWTRDGVGVWDSCSDESSILLDLPPEICRPDAPRYELVLRRVKE